MSTDEIADRAGLERPVVIGAGPGGLAVAWTLTKAGLDPIVIDRASVPCSTWAGFYGSMRMNSWRRLSSLPGMRLSAEYGPWPMRDDFLAYMRRYVAVLDPDIRFDTVVDRVDQEGDHWVVRTSDGAFPTRTVVVATGLHQTNFVPEWPGLEEFSGEFLHARDYQVPDPLVGKDVLVVGCGPTGIDIAVAAARAGASRVRMSIRTMPVLFKLSPVTSILSQLIKFTPTPAWLVDRISLAMTRLQWGDLTRHGFPRPTEGTMTGIARSGHTFGSIDRGLIAAVKEGSIEIVRGVAGFEGDAVLLDDGSSIRPEVVVAATGQRPGLDKLVGHLGVVAEVGGRPLVHGGTCAPHAPGLYFQGFRVPSGQVPDMSVDAWAIARAVGRNPLLGRLPAWRSA